MYDDKPGIYRVPGRSFHATIVQFPIACFVGTLLTDLAYVATDSFVWETFSVWLLTIGCVVAGLAVLAGVVDLVRSRRVRGLAQPPIRVLGEIVAFALSIVNAFVHSRDGYTAVFPQGLILSALVVLVLAVTFLRGRAVTPLQRDLA